MPTWVLAEIKVRLKANRPMNFISFPSHVSLGVINLKDSYAPIFKTFLTFTYFN